MATDLESTTEPGEVATPRPSLKITGLHIRGLKSIGSLDLPGDGLGWDGPIPDFLMVGGINGSGKTTLLEFLASIFDHPGGSHRPPSPTSINAWVDFQLELIGFGSTDIRYIVGDKSFIEDHRKEKDWFGLEIGRTRLGLTLSARFPDFVHPLLMNMMSSNQLPEDHIAPCVVYIPCDRGLIIPETSFKTPGSLTSPNSFLQRWQRPEEWKDSLPAHLYALRWADLNAKEEGRPEEATHFRSYQLAFDRFFEGRKRIKWTAKGELVVETKSGDIHDLSELSSGEKQVILFMGELLHRWRPGSLILIDEPELHLHESYQTKLWESLVEWQKERGGQVIVATQSDHLFGISDPDIKVLLSVRRGR